MKRMYLMMGIFMSIAVFCFFHTSLANPFLHAVKNHGTGGSTFLLAQYQSDDGEDGCDDYDADGYGDPASPDCLYPQRDCDDSNPDVYPGAPELCDGIDNQCPGNRGYCLIDEGCEFALLNPPNYAVVHTPPILQWAAGKYNLFRVILTIPLFGMNWSIQLPWIPCTSYNLSFLPLFTLYWQYITPNVWASWYVMALNTQTLQFQVFGPYRFKKGINPV